MERIRTLLAVIVSTVLTLGFLGCGYLTLQGKGQAYYQGIVTPATTALFLVLTLAMVVLAVLPDRKSDDVQEPHSPEPQTSSAHAGSVSTGPSQYRAVVEVPVEEE